MEDSSGVAAIMTVSPCRLMIRKVVILVDNLRQIDDKGCPCIRSTVHRDRAAMTGNNPMRHRQSHTRALANAFGREQGHRVRSLIYSSEVRIWRKGLREAGLPLRPNTIALGLWHANHTCIFPAREGQKKGTDLNGIKLGVGPLLPEGY